jgi:hypothetical protein
VFNEQLKPLERRIDYSVSLPCGRADGVKYSSNSELDGKNIRERAVSGSRRLWERVSFIGIAWIGNKRT